MGTCFVVQGFGKKPDPTKRNRVLNLDASYKIIRKAVRAAGHECVRADEIRHSGTIDVPMYDQLLRADLVIADLSTYNVNAAFELGVRYALRPHATIVIAEEQYQHAFDIARINIFRYKHLGEDIGAEEAERIQKDLKSAVDAIFGQKNIDSPVFTYIPGLKSALERMEEDREQTPWQVQALAAATPPSSDEEETCKALLDGALDKMQPPRDRQPDFGGAARLLSLLRDRRPHDAYVTQLLALATCKTTSPPSLAELLRAHELLGELDPDSTGDPETLALWGSVHKELWELQSRPAQLDEAIHAFARAFHLQQDPANGASYAYLLDARAMEWARSGNRDDAVADQVYARRTRQAVLDRMTRERIAELDELPPSHRYQLRAAMWEVCEGLGCVEDAARWEKKTLDPGLNQLDAVIKATQAQLRRLRAVQVELRTELATH